MNPTTLKHIHLFFMIIWILMVPISIYLGWINSIPFISALSITALSLAEFSSWQSARTEEKQQMVMEADDNDYDV